MNKPYITCYMATSIDGRIDCPMTEKLPGLDNYYPLLEAFNFDATLSGRVTAELEIAEKGKFTPKTCVAVGKEVVSNKSLDRGWLETVVDTNGTLLWKNAKDYETDVVVITSEKASAEYLEYLDGKGISYIVTGKEKIDLVRAVELLAVEFGVKTLGIVGGSAINTAFLDADLLDEIVLLIGAGIDGRASFPTIFSRNDNCESTFRALKFVEAKAFETGAVLIRYKTK